MKRIIVASCALLLAGVAMAQDAPDFRPNNNFSGVGEFVREVRNGETTRQRAYREELNSILDTQLAVENAKAAKAQMAHMEIEDGLRIQLLDIWRGTGLPETEIKSLVAAYKLDAPIQLAMIDRAKREGMKVTVAAAIKAYQDYNYLLANQLMLAATRPGVPTP